MLVFRRVRPIVSLLLAVATAIGVAIPARACGCTPTSVPVSPASVRKANPAPIAKAHGQPAKKRACCSAGSTCDAAKAPCCVEPVPSAQTDESPRPEQLPAPSGCHCARCDCDAPTAPAVPAPAPGAPDADAHVAVSPVPPVLIAEPHTSASRTVRSVHTGPPADLVISLSRLTC